MNRGDEPGTFSQPRADLALLLGKASEFARLWQMQSGCGAQVLDELADVIVSYLGDNPQLAQAGGEALRPRAVIIDDPVRARQPGKRTALFAFDVSIELAAEDLPGGLRKVHNTSSLTLEVKRADGQRILFPPTAVAVLEPGDTVQTRTPPGPGGPLMRQVASADEVDYAKRISRRQFREGADYLWITRLPDGRALYLMPWHSGGAQLSLGEFGAAWFMNTWDYHAGYTDEAWRAVLSWDGHGEPDGWTRHPASGRVRPDGTAESERQELP